MWTGWRSLREEKRGPGVARPDRTNEGGIKSGKGEAAMTEGDEGGGAVLRGFCRPYLHGNHMRRARASAVQE